MKKRAILTTIVAFLLLVAVIAAGLNAVFTVTYVDARFLTYTEDGETAARELKEDLNEYLGKSTTFLDLEEVRATAETYPRFRVVSVGKEYPSSVIVEIIERRAAFALASSDGWDILDTDGVRIGNSDSADTYMELKGDFTFSYENGVVAGSYVAQVLELYDVLSELLGEPRANIISVTFEDSGNTATDSMDRFRIATREGVEIVIRDPAVRIGDKVRAAVELYLSLSENERVCGTINSVIVESTGNVSAQYFRDGTSE